MLRLRTFLRQDATVMAAKKRGLGKPLDALLVGSYTTYAEPVSNPDTENETVRQLPVELIQSGKYQPRRHMDPTALEDLANSIRAQGIVQPILVRRKDNNRYEIIAGERRWRAAQLAGLTEVPALIRDIPDESAMSVALIENIQREDLNSIEEAMALQRLLEEFSMTHQQIADSVGKSRTTVTNLLRLLSLTDEAKTLLENGDLEMGHARALLALSGDTQIQAAQTIAAKNLSVRETEVLIRRLQSPSQPSAAPKPTDPDVKRLENDIARRLGAAVSIRHNTKGKGKMVIQYHSLEELEGILAVLAVQ